MGLARALPLICRPNAIHTQPRPMAQRRAWALPRKACHSQAPRTFKRLIEFRTYIHTPRASTPVSYKDPFPQCRIIDLRSPPPPSLDVSTTAEGPGEVAHDGHNQVLAVPRREHPAVERDLEQPGEVFSFISS